MEILQDKYLYRYSGICYEYYYFFCYNFFQIGINYVFIIYVVFNCIFLVLIKLRKYVR